MESAKITPISHGAKRKKQVRTREEFLSSCKRCNPYFLFVTFAMGINWGLSGFFLVTPAYISSSEFKDNTTEFWKVQDEFPLNYTWLELPEYVATSFSAGNLLIGPIFSVLSDWYGRRKVVVSSILCMGLGSIVCASMPNFELLLVARFLHGSFYAPTTLVTWVLCSETIPKKIHSEASVVFGMSWIFGSALVAPAAYLFPHWRQLLYVLAIPNIILGIVLFFTLEESLEYMLLRQDKESAMRLIDKIQKYEKRIVEIDIDLMISNAEKKRLASESTSSNFFPNLRSKPKFAILMMICTYMSFTSTLLHNTMSLTSTVIIAGNAHTNFVFSSLVEIPSYVIVPFLQKSCGKVYTLFLFNAVTALSNICLSFLSSDAALYAVFWFLAKFACSSAFMCILILGSQEFPVECRNIAIGFCSTIGNIGAVVAPQCELLNSLSTNLMFRVFAVCSTLATFMALIIPKSNNLEMPNSIRNSEEDVISLNRFSITGVSV